MCAGKPLQGHPAATGQLIVRVNRVFKDKPGHLLVGYLGLENFGAQPRGRMRTVFSLGPSDRISLTKELKDAFPFGIPNKTVSVARYHDTMVGRVQRKVLQARSMDDMLTEYLEDHLAERGKEPDGDSRLSGTPFRILIAP